MNAFRTTCASQHVHVKYQRTDKVQNCYLKTLINVLLITSSFRQFKLKNSSSFFGVRIRVENANYRIFRHIRCCFLNKISYYLSPPVCLFLSLLFPASLIYLDKIAKLMITSMHNAAFLANTSCALMKCKFKREPKLLYRGRCLITHYA